MSKPQAKPVPKASAKAAAAPGKALVKPEAIKKGSTEAALVSNAALAAYAADSGAGLENIGRDELSIPFLAIVQKMSKITDTDPGAKAGMFINTVTKELFEGETGPGIRFVPVHRAKMYVEWVPLDQGGGFKGQHAPESELVQRVLLSGKDDEDRKPGLWPLANGHELVETYYVFGLLLLDDGRAEPMIIGFTSTQTKAYRAWMTRATGLRLPVPGGSGQVQLPLYGACYRLRTLKRQNDKGTWHVFDVTLDGKLQEALIDPASELYAQAKGFRQMVVAGQVRAATESLDATGPGGASSEDDAI